MAEIKDYSTTAGNNNSASPNGMGEGMAPSGVNDSWREQTARIKRWYEDASAVNSLAGGTTAYTLAASRTISAYAAGDTFLVRCNATNTGASTLNVDSVGAKNIVMHNQNPLNAGDLVEDGIYLFSYDATNDTFIAVGLQQDLSESTGFLNVKTADQTGIVSGTNTAITWNTTPTHDPDSAWTSGTNSYTTPRTGWYALAASATWDTQFAADEPRRIWINSSTRNLIADSWTYQSAAGRSMSSVCTVRPLSAAEVITVRAYHLAGTVGVTTADIDGDGSQTGSAAYFSVVYLGATA